MNPTAERCYHCEEPIPAGYEFPARVLEIERHMCCPGCQAVAEAIVANGLEDYYRFRTEPAEKATGVQELNLADLDVFDDEQVQEEFIRGSGEVKEIQLTIEGISCAACAWLIEKKLVRLIGIKQVAVNVGARRATLSWYAEQIQLSDILFNLEKIGYRGLPFQPDKHEASYQREHKAFLKRLGLAGLLGMQVMMLAAGLYFDFLGDADDGTRRYFNWVAWALSTPVVLYSATEFFRGAVNALRNLTANMDVPVSIAIIALYLASSWATFSGQGETHFESICMFVFLLLVSRFLEHRSRHNAALMSANNAAHLPMVATLLPEKTPVLAKKLNIGDRILVKPGETIAADGKVLEGISQVDESMLSGEFAPVHKGVADEVFAGSINHAGALQIEVTRVAADARLNHILRLQELALAQKPAVAKMADRLASWFVWVVLLIATLSFAFWWQMAPERALWVAIAVLVATCPCALGLATPSALIATLARLNRQGWLVKRADLLEQLPHINQLVFDKTGTLTQGRFSIAKASYMNPAQADYLRLIAASLEAYSEHPIAAAFTTDEPLLAVSDLNILPGKGLRGIADGKVFALGSAALLSAPIPDKLIGANVWLQQNEQVVAAFWLQDSLREDAKNSIQALNALPMLLLSGDNESQVSAIAKQVGITHWQSAATPEQKLATVSDLQKKGQRVLMLGDGINDSPVLAKADVSIAVGAASDIAKQSADILLINGQLKLLPELLHMAKRCQQTIRQNFAWALGYNLLVLPLAVSGLLSPWMAVVGMSLSSIIVVANATRLLKT